MAYRRKDSPYWWVKYTDASGKRTDRSTGTTDRREAQALEAKWRLEAHQMRQWGVQPEHTFDELMVAYLKATSDTMRDPERATYAIQRLRPFFTGRVMERLRRSDVSAYIEKTEGRPGWAVHGQSRVGFALGSNQLRPKALGMGHPESGFGDVPPAA